MKIFVMYNDIGYESVSHFIKAFKEKYGFTPKQGQ